MDAAKMYDHIVWRLYSDATKDMTNNLLTDEEIEHAKVTDPDIPAFKVKQLCLLKGVAKYNTKRKNSYFVQLTNENGKLQFFGSFKTLEEANEKAKQIQEEIKAKKELMLQSTPITKDENNQAFIIAGKNAKNPVHVLVDSNLWHEISRYGWSIANGYVTGRVNGKQVLLHRFIWYFVHGEESIPTDHVLDHKNRIKTDCQLSNLRILTKSENSHNCTKRKNCSSSMIGVSFNTSIQRWEAYCKGKYLGVFDSEEEASIAYEKEAKIIFPNCYGQDITVTS